TSKPLTRPPARDPDRCRRPAAGKPKRGSTAGTENTLTPKLPIDVAFDQNVGLSSNPVADQLFLDYWGLVRGVIVQFQVRARHRERPRLPANQRLSPPSAGPVPMPGVGRWPRPGNRVPSRSPGRTRLPRTVRSVRAAPAAGCAPAAR